MTTSDKPRYFIGLMSGTSVDGVDAALVDGACTPIKLLKMIEYPLPETLKRQLIQLNHTPNLTLEAFCRLEHDVAIAFVKATQTLLTQTHLTPADITAIGSHGQTLFHAPNIPMSLQIGHPAFIAKHTNIDTVADFRVDDMAVGGQGAPLAPSFHQPLFENDQACYVVNIGGIANVSYLQPKTKNQTNRAPAFGFDTGPGNALMDEICQQQLGVKFDQNGDIAKRGQVHQTLLEGLLQHPYFTNHFPKSTGRETFNSQWLEKHTAHLANQITSENLIATLCELTAQTIQRGIAQLAKQLNAPTGTIWIVGGGAYNHHLLSRIQHALPAYCVQSSLKCNIDPNAIEAMMCAWLAQQRIDHQPIPLKSVTGSQRDVVLGGLWLGR